MTKAYTLPYQKSGEKFKYYLETLSNQEGYTFLTEIG